MKFLHRLAAILSATVLSAGALVMFSGCTSSNPTVTITYSFNGKDYDVEYTLSRSDAPKTVQHFIELADAHYYDGTCIHDYTSTAIYGGGYYYDERNELVEKDYFAAVRALENEGNTFTQSVWYMNGGTKVPLYTVYGEFSDNGVDNASDREYSHSKGALVMYYSDKTTSAKDIEVTVERNDGGKGNNGVKEEEKRYANNSATSLFYTYLGTSNTSLDNKYAVFGKADLDQLQKLLDAVEEATPEDDETTEEDESIFTREVQQRLDTLDHQATVDVFADIADVFESVRKGGTSATFNVPDDQPILIKTVKVTKY